MQRYHLTAKDVKTVMMDCLFHDGEPHDNAVLVEGVTRNFGLHPDRLKKNSDRIKQMLMELPATFFKDTGGGWSFLNAVYDRYNIQWAEHKDVESLVVLGIAIGVVKYCAPRDLWSAFPGGVPYFVVDLVQMTESEPAAQPVQETPAPQKKRPDHK
jgi:hypothetical protein